MIINDKLQSLDSKEILLISQQFHTEFLFDLFD